VRCCRWLSKHRKLSPGEAACFVGGPGAAGDPPAGAASRTVLPSSDVHSGEATAEVISPPPPPHTYCATPSNCIFAHKGASLMMHSRGQPYVLPPSRNFRRQDAECGAERLSSDVGPADGNTNAPHRHLAIVLRPTATHSGPEPYVRPFTHLKKKFYPSTGTLTTERL